MTFTPSAPQLLTPDTPAVDPSGRLSKDYFDWLRRFRLTLSYLRSPVSTVDGLPSASVAGTGSRMFVTNAATTTFNTTISGTGSYQVPVFSDGSTSWKIG